MNSVFIVDDHPVIRLAVRMLLEHEGYKVVGETDNGVDAIRLSMVFAGPPEDGVHPTAWHLDGAERPCHALARADELREVRGAVEFERVNFQYEDAAEPPAEDGDE